MIVADEQVTAEPKLYSVSETCRLLRISRWSFYRLLQRRELRTITIGRRRLVTAADLEVFVRGRQSESDS